MGPKCLVTGVMHAQKSGTAFWYQKLASNRAACYSAQVSGIIKLAQGTCTSFWYCRHAGDIVRPIRHIGLGKELGILFQLNNK